MTAYARMQFDDVSQEERDAVFNALLSYCASWIPWRCEAWKGILNEYNEEHVSRFKAVDDIKNRFGHQFITKASTLYRVKGNTHFLERNA